MTNPFGCGPNPCSWTCRESLCSKCSGEVPTVIPATIAGFVNTGNCADCTNINTTWLNEFRSEPSECEWIKGEIGFACGGDVNVWVEFIEDFGGGGGTWFMQVRIIITQPPLSQTHIFRTTASQATWDCTTNRAIPWNSQSGSFLCDSSGATCVIN